MQEGGSPGPEGRSPINISVRDWASSAYSFKQVTLRLSTCKFSSLFHLTCFSIFLLSILITTVLHNLSFMHCRPIKDTLDLVGVTLSVQDYFLESLVCRNLYVFLFYSEYQIVQHKHNVFSYFSGCNIIHFSYLFFSSSSVSIQQWASPFTTGVSWLSRPDQLTRLQTANAEC